MEVKILWSESALAQLEEIFEFHKTRASATVARNLVKTIIQNTMIMESNPFIGVKEPLLSDRSFEYRYLIVKNYKIIYRYDDNIVRINMIFDCRQDPGKMVGLKGKITNLTS
jgi:plasmid stabilization system protein ParE